LVSASINKKGLIFQPFYIKTLKLNLDEISFSFQTMSQM
jgi:hypothetical protein